MDDNREYRFLISHAVKPRECFYDLDTTGFEDIINSDSLKRHLLDGSKRYDVCGTMLTYFFKMLIEDVIDNNVMFKLPSKREAYIELHKIGGEELKKARQNGAFSNVDLLRSGFTAARIRFRAKVHNRWLTKNMYVYSHYRDRIYQNLYDRKY